MPPKKGPLSKTELKGKTNEEIRNELVNCLKEYTITLKPVADARVLIIENIEKSANINDCMALISEFDEIWRISHLNDDWYGITVSSIEDVVEYVQKHHSRPKNECVFFIG